MTLLSQHLAILAILFNVSSAMAQTPPSDPATLSPAQEDALIGRLLPRVRGAEHRQPLPNARAALAYGEHVILATEGQRSFDNQAPFHAKDCGSTWVVAGSRPLNSMLTPVEVELRKEDASVVKYGMTLDGIGPAPMAQ